MPRVDVCFAPHASSFPRSARQYRPSTVYELSPSIVSKLSNLIKPSTSRFIISRLDLPYCSHSGMKYCGELADSHRHKQCQGYAATTGAACYAKELLGEVDAVVVEQSLYSMVHFFGLPRRRIAAIKYPLSYAYERKYSGVQVYMLIYLNATHFIPST
jgi:hypothetical protein